MKTIFFAVLCLVFLEGKAFEGGIKYARMKPETTGVSMVDSLQPDVYPKWKDCPSADGSEAGFKKCLSEYIRSNVQNPKNVEGRVYVSLRIQPDGSIEKMGIRGKDSDLNNEAERLVNGMPLFVPAQKGGVSVAYSFHFPLIFQKGLDLFSDKVRYETHPDSYPKWENTIIDSESRKEFSKRIHDFFRERVNYDKETGGKAYILVRVTETGEAGIAQISCKDEELTQTILQTSEKLPKLIPARKKNKDTAFEGVVILDFGKKKESEKQFNINQWVKLKSCETSSPISEREFKKCLDEYVKMNFIYPDEAVKKNIQGRVHVIFEVNKDGKVEVKALLGGDILLQASAYHLIRKLPVVSPAYEKGNPVKIVLIYPITYRIRK